MLSESDIGDEKSLYCYGMHFCPTCQNLMHPVQANGPQLQFLCEKCNKKYPIDYTKKQGEDTLLYSKEIQAGTRKFAPDTAYIFDPTMPSVDIECPECGYDRAVYLLTPDEGQTKLLTVMICASSTGTVAKCGHHWILDETTELTHSRVISAEERLFQNFE